MSLSKNHLSKSKHNPFLTEFDFSEIERGNFNDIKRLNKLTETVKSQKTPLEQITVSRKSFNKKSLLSVIYNFIVGEDNSTQKEVSKKIVSDLEEFYIDSDIVNIDDLLADIARMDSARNYISSSEYQQFYEVVNYIESKATEICLNLFIRNITKILQKLITPFLRNCSLVFHQSPSRIFFFEYIDINNSHPYRKLIPNLNYQFSNFNHISKNRDEKGIIRHYVFAS